MTDVFFGLYNPSPPDPKRPLNNLNMFVATYCPKDILGLGWKAPKNKLKDTSLIFSMTNITIISIFRTHAHDECRKDLEMKSTSILNILALLLLES